MFDNLNSVVCQHRLKELINIISHRREDTTRRFRNKVGRALVSSPKICRYRSSRSQTDRFSSQIVDFDRMKIQVKLMRHHCYYHEFFFTKIG